ncbi:hypothetical protein [Desertivirga xinjiangensis]|uniref:hypothetical protein n=1 Tax=Desertivirga xinjiangensis TaxID=539206 RepID=UPI00210A94DC|nr:hypothetical protein [Pedobacter xinjiangensis]
MKLVPTILSMIDINPSLKYQWKKSDYLVVNSTTTGKSLEVLFWDKENTLYFESWHWHYQNEIEDEDLTNTILDLITNKATLKIVKRGERIIRNELEFQYDVENIRPALTTGFLNLNLRGSNEFEYQKIIFT